jgi:hypothetical protein
MQLQYRGGIAGMWYYSVPGTILFQSLKTYM